MCLKKACQIDKLTLCKILYVDVLVKLGSVFLI